MSAIIRNVVGFFSEQRTCLKAAIKSRLAHEWDHFPGNSELLACLQLLTVHPVELRDAFYFKIGTHQTSGRFYPWGQSHFWISQECQHFSRYVNSNQYLVSYYTSRGSIPFSEYFLPLAPYSHLDFTTTTTIDIGQFTL